MQMESQIEGRAPWSFQPPVGRKVLTSPGGFCWEVGDFTRKCLFQKLLFVQGQQVWGIELF